MQNTAADFSAIRRLEAVSFRSFPATSTFFNGTWAIRLTAGHPAKRLNSINPLDPGDSWNIKKRLSQEIQRFDNIGRPVVFRVTPLAPAALLDHLEELGWVEFDESMVMTLDLDTFDLEQAADQLPFRDTGRWVDAFLSMEQGDESLKPGMVEVIEATTARTALFLLENKYAKPLCAMRSVLDNELIGLFDIVTSSKHRRQGLAASLISNALRWAQNEGASKAWLQVVCANQPAVSFYRSIGFKTLYRYVYRCPPQSRKS